MYSLTIEVRSASLIFWVNTCLAVETATLPKSLGVTSCLIVSPTFASGSIFLASSRSIWASSGISGSP